MENILLAQTYESNCDQKKILHSLVEFKSQDMNIFIEVIHILLTKGNKLGCKDNMI